MAVLRWEEIHHMREVIGKGVAGVVLVLPPENSTAQDEDMELQTMELEHKLFQVSFMLGKPFM